MDAQARLQMANRVSIITIIINIALSVVKMVAGILTMSLSVVSDAVHSATDVLTTVVVMVGMKIAAGDVDKEHPYGHEKFEAVASKLLAVILSIVAAFILYGGIMKLIHRQTIEISAFAIGVTVASIVVKEWMYHYTKRAAKKINSNALLADAWHHRSDSVSSIAVLVGLIFARFGIIIAEPIATIIVSLMIIKVAVSIYISSTNQLVDHAADEKTIKHIEEIITGTPGVIRIDKLKTRQHVNYIYVDVDICVDAEITVKEGHSIAQRVHDNLEMDSSLMVKHCMVHVNPL